MEPQEARSCSRRGAAPGVTMVDSMVTPIDLVKMVVDLEEAVEKLKKRVAQLEGG